MGGRQSRRHDQMVAEDDEVILSLDMVNCFLTFCDVPQTVDWREEQQRTLMLTKDKDQSDDICTMKIYDKKHRLQLKESVTFCGIQLYSRESISSKKKLQVRQCLDLIFREITSTFIFTEADHRVTDWTKYCLKRCELVFGHVLTKCVDLKAHPATCSRMDGKNQVLLSLTRNRFTLSAKGYPHTRITSWSIDKIKPRLESESLCVDIANEGTYVFTSRMDSSWMEDVYRSIGDYHELKDSYLEPIAANPETRNDQDESIYFDIRDEITCEKCREMYLTCLQRTDVSNQSSFSMDLNEFLQMKGSLYRRVVRMLADDYSGYVPTCTYKGKNRESVVKDYGYLTPSSETRDIRKDEPERNCGDVNTDNEATTSNVQVNTDNEATTSNVQVNTHSQTEMNTIKVTKDCEQSSEIQKERIPNRNELCSSSRDSSDPGEVDAADPLPEFIQMLKKLVESKEIDKDTLQLPSMVRFRLCWCLYTQSASTAGTCMEDWQLFGEIIGMTAETIYLISAIIRTHCLNQPAAELVLRYWQYVYNTYGETDPDGRCPYACNTDNLIRILSRIGRSDLIELIQKSRQLTIV